MIKFKLAKLSQRHIVVKLKANRDNEKHQQALSTVKKA